jgi:soluble lytic murein transglycosylase-like protein
VPNLFFSAPFEDLPQLSDNPSVTFSNRILSGTLCFLVLALFSPVSSAQSLQARSDSIRAATEAGKVSEALSLLRSLKNSNRPALELNNFDYLLARLLEQGGDRAGAATNYQAVLERNSPLSQYAIWHLARLARSTGDLVLERERLRRLIVMAPASLLREAAIVRLGASFSESKDYLGVVSTLRPLTESSNLPVARHALALSAEAYLHAGKAAEARDIFNKLVSTMPDVSRPDDFALAAVRGLDALDKSQAKDLAESEHLARAAIYQFNRDFDGARAHYLATVGSMSAPDSLFQVGRGYYQQGKFNEALESLNKVANYAGSSSSIRDALALQAATYSRLKRTDEAVNTYKLLIDRYPNAPNPERAYLNIIDVLRDAGRTEEALSWVKQTRANFKDQLGSTLALFSQARINLSRGAWNAAISDLEELELVKDLGGLRVAGGTTTSEIMFLRGLALELSGRPQAAIELYLAISTGRNEYYGFRADERLRFLSSEPKSRDLIASQATEFRAAAKRQLESNEIEAARRSAQTALRLEKESGKRKELIEIVRRAYDNSPAYRFPSLEVLSLGRREVFTAQPTAKDETVTHQVLANELLFLGLYDEGALELAAARSESSKAKPEQEKSTSPPNTSGADSAADAAYTQAVYYLRGGMPHPAVRFAEQTWRAIPSDYLMELAPRQLSEMLYPVPFRESLLKNARVRQLDTRFVLSIARQETRFQADAKSVAAARGLMQFIAATAEATAKELGRRDFDQDELYNPDTAIQFGSQYLATLFRQFPNQPQAVAGAYNGGPENVARWIARSGSQEPDRYVPEIGFAQSKDYIFRVMSNYWVYQTLYSDSLQPLVENR